MRIDWERVWKGFERWLKNREDGVCSKCNHMLSDYPDWEEQQKKIQQLVNNQLRSKK